MRRLGRGRLFDVVERLREGGGVHAAAPVDRRSRACRASRSARRLRSLATSRRRQGLGQQSGPRKSSGTPLQREGPPAGTSSSAARHRRQNGAGSLREPVLVARFRSVPAAFAMTGPASLESAAQHDRLAVRRRQGGRAPRLRKACKGRRRSPRLYRRGFFRAPAASLKIVRRSRPPAGRRRFQRRARRAHSLQVNRPRWLSVTAIAKTCACHGSSNGGASGAFKIGLPGVDRHLDARIGVGAPQFGPGNAACSTNEGLRPRHARWNRGRRSSRAPLR